MKGIYKITNLINLKVYIGQSDRLNDRKREHFYRLKRNEHNNEHLQKSYDKYGEENFIFEIIEETDDLDNREIYWINEYGGINSELNYNLKDPLTKKWCDYIRLKQCKIMAGENNPNFGNKWSKEQKEKLSKMKKGVTLEKSIGKEKADLTKLKMSKSQKGRKHPEEVKEKIRQANIGEKNPAYGKGYRQVGEKNPMWGKHLSKQAKEKISQANIGKNVSDGTRKKMSESAKNRKRLMSDEVKEKIRQANIGEKNPAYGKGYRQVGEKNPMWGKAASTRKGVLQMNENGDIIKEYNFLSEVKTYGFNPSNVLNCANEKNGFKTSKGFYWKWKTI